MRGLKNRDHVHNRYNGHGWMKAETFEKKNTKQNSLAFSYMQTIVLHFFRINKLA